MHRRKLIFIHPWRKVIIQKEKSPKKALGSNKMGTLEFLLRVATCTPTLSAGR